MANFRPGKQEGGAAHRGNTPGHIVLYLALTLAEDDFGPVPGAWHVARQASHLANQKRSGGRDEKVEAS
jgi:hypothetical protein